MTYIMTLLMTLHGCTIMKAESVRWEGARQEGPARQLIEHPQEERTKQFLAHYSE